VDNQKVRAHLRKGEQAVALLESLGYSYGSNIPTRWEAPTKSELELFKEQLTELLTPPEKRNCPVRAGATFNVISLPPGHFLNAYTHRYMRFTALSTEWIEEGSEKSKRINGFTGWVVHFDAFPASSSPKGLWLPLSCIKVASNADF